MSDTWSVMLSNLNDLKDKHSVLWTPHIAQQAASQHEMMKVYCEEGHAIHPGIFHSTAEEVSLPQGWLSSSLDLIHQLQSPMLSLLLWQLSEHGLLLL